MSIYEIPRASEGPEVYANRGPGVNFADSTRQLEETTKHVDNDLAVVLAGLNAAVEAMDRTAQTDKETSLRIGETTTTMVAAAHIATSSQHMATPSA